MGGKSSNLMAGRFIQMLWAFSEYMNFSWRSNFQMRLAFEINPPLKPQFLLTMVHLLVGWTEFTINICDWKISYEKRRTRTKIINVCNASVDSTLCIICFIMLYDHFWGPVPCILTFAKILFLQFLFMNPWLL